MYNPDEKEAPHELAGSMRAKSEPKPYSNILPEKERIRFYLVNCSGMRAHYGFDMVQGPDYKKRLIIKDAGKLERLDSQTKQILRELYQELK